MVSVLDRGNAREVSAVHRNVRRSERFESQVGTNPNRARSHTILKCHRVPGLYPAGARVLVVWDAQVAVQRTETAIVRAQPFCHSERSRIVLLIHAYVVVAELM